MSIDPKTIKKDDCRSAAFPASGDAKRSDDFRVVISRSVLNTIRSLGLKSMSAEVGGMLVGELLWDEGPFLRIDASIEGRYTDEKTASVTFTSQTWDYVHEEMDRAHPDKKIVGWYHTHPGFGIFLSGMDLFIHENFFSMPWQIAYVYDPHSSKDGIFVWSEGKLKQHEAMIIEDEKEIDNPKPGNRASDAGSESCTPGNCSNRSKTPKMLYLLMVLMILLQLLTLTVIGLLQHEKLAPFFINSETSTERQEDEKAGK